MVVHRKLTCSNVIASSRSPIPLSSSSSSSAKLVRPPLAPPKAACLPARENGLDLTAVPNTLAFPELPKVAKSVTTFRAGDAGGDTPPSENVLGGLSGIRGGMEGE